MSIAVTIGAIIGDAIERRIFPGAVVLVARGESVLHAAAYGSTMYDDAGSRPVTLDTIYDVASLTKVFTATAALRLVEAGAIDLDAAVRSYLDGFSAADITVRHLLTHTSGLSLRLSALCRDGAEALRAAAYAAPRAHPPGAVVAYTNINSLLLGDIVARLTGLPLGAAIEQLVLAPLGLRDTRFCPPAALLPRIAPTEIDASWRGGLVHGAVHDESAHALGGVAGHAGLFSTAADLHRFCLAWLPGGAAPGSPLLQPATIALATRNHTPHAALACGLGWMLDRALFMGPAPPGSYGHTGFTGPAIVIVPTEHLIVVILSNRTYPQRRAAEHHAVTAALLASVLEGDE